MLEGFIFLSENAITGQSFTNNFRKKMASRILILVEHSFFVVEGESSVVGMMIQPMLSVRYVWYRDVSTHTSST